jgi:hypothetical protein
MAQFVNYHKRSIELPQGCKDLIDVLEPSRRSAANKSEAGRPLPQIRDEHFRTDGLSQVGRQVAMLESSSAELFALMIVIRDDRPPLTVYRKQRTNQAVLVLVAEDADRERAIRAFLGERGVQPLHSAAVPDAFKSLSFLLPREVSQISDLMTDLLRAVYELSDVAGLDFYCCEMGSAA